MKKFSIVGFAGVASVIIYTLTIIIGGLLRPEYTLFIDPVSRIFARGLPNSNIIIFSFALSNIMVTVFAVGVIKLTKNFAIRAGMISLIIASIIGCILYIFFPMDPWLGVRTAADIVHNNVVTAMALFILLSMFSVYFGSKSEKDWRKLSGYFLVSAILFLITGVVSAICLQYYWGLVGTFESLWIIIFLQWLGVVAYRLEK